MNSALPPAARISSTTFRPPSGTTSETTTAAPSAAKRRAASAPSPEPEPVMTATLPDRRPMAILSRPGLRGRRTHLIESQASSQPGQDREGARDQRPQPGPGQLTPARNSA